ncbi:hypothetical protein [Chelatococcus asaccharovorans]|nr:hypothetical protein [Chelatococcus asaccharovorans]
MRAGAAHHDLTRSEEKQVVLASTLGTIFAWYDFFIYDSLAVFMSSVLFPPRFSSLLDAGNRSGIPSSSLRWYA